MATKKTASKSKSGSAARKKEVAAQEADQGPMPVAEHAPAPSEVDDTIKGGERSGFGTRIGFILAAIGSAVGFGSIARFPMNAANNGGAVFLVMYLGIMVLIGIPMMIAEFSLGRSAQKNNYGAFRVLSGEPKTKWRFAGLLFIIMAGFVLSYYGILTGWTLRYLFGSITGSYFGDSTAFLTETSEGPVALYYFAAVMIMTALVLTTKVSKGIEKANLFMMPALFGLIASLAIYAAFLDDVGPGYAYYLQPDMSALTVPVFAAAVGQAFFSLSLAQGAMMTYSSYIPRTTSLASNAAIISGSTLTFATMCGFLIFPLLASFGYALNPETPAGLGLIFGPLADTFAQMGTPVGQIVGTAFFLATFFAAFSSALSLAEPAIAYFTEEHGIDRRRGAFLACAIMYIFGIWASFSSDLLGVEAAAMTDAGIMLGGLLIAVYVGWFSPWAVARQRMDESDSGLRLSWFAYPVVRYAMPVILTVLLVFVILGTPCGLTGGGSNQGLIEQLGGPGLIGCRG